MLEKQANQEQILIQLANHQQLHHKFVEFYNDQEHILLNTNLQKQLCFTFIEFYSNQDIK